MNLKTLPAAWKLLSLDLSMLTHWGRVTHICVSKLIIIGSDNGLSPGRRQAIIWTNAGILLIGPLGTNFSEIFIKIHAFSFKKMHLNMSSAKQRPLCLSLNVLSSDCQWCWHYLWLLMSWCQNMPHGLPSTFSSWSDHCNQGNMSVFKWVFEWRWMSVYL